MRQPRGSSLSPLILTRLEPAYELAGRLSGLAGILKIGMQLFTACGPEGLRKIASLGSGIFLDLKFHDIPNTVAGAVRAAIELPNLKLLNVHALGGLEMMRAAAQARDTWPGARNCWGHDSH